MLEDTYNLTKDITGQTETKNSNINISGIKYARDKPKKAKIRANI